MSDSLLQYLGSQPMMQVVRGLLLNPEQRHLRDLASQYSLSPSGVSDILRRLKKAGVLTEKRIGNRRCVGLDLSSDEVDCLRHLFSIYENSILRQRSESFSRGATEKLEWMDQAYQFYRTLKRAEHDSA